MYHKLMLENQTMFTKQVFEQLEGRELSSGQPKILEYLYEHDGSVQKDIAQACKIEPATVTSLLSRMEKSEIIERRMQNNNRRFWYVYLTEKGREEAVYVKKAFDTVKEIALKDFTNKEKELFIQYLKRVNKNLKEELI
ncbi:MarR family winged helix-turn-helix transcriptional regulator [Lacrimispora sp. AGF001]|uniref:MarR family winged helix-turn-helix transcriptional regulator n=1 Tax=Lacrimispora sp. AGF001 TaxID=3401631 RepID=UPI003B4379A5|nr:MarR family transcriptional regulator [Paenibacillaceae bacterium]